MSFYETHMLILQISVTVLSSVINVLPAVSVLPTSLTMDVRHSKLFTATASGGSGTYSPSTGYQWYVNAISQVGQTASTFSFVPASVGTYNITATVTDSNGLTSAPSNNATVTVSAASSTTTTQLSVSSISYGDSVTVTATVTSGATGTMNFQSNATGSWVTFSTKSLVSGQATSDAYYPSSTGTFWFRAVYLGDSNYAASESADDAESLTVTQVSYSVTFTQTGLPLGQSWGVTFNGQPKFSTTTIITFSGIPAGSYAWSVSSPISGGPGVQYLKSPSTGTMNVSAPTTQLITYQKQYSVTFADSGIGSDFTGTVLNIGGTSYTRAQLPKTFWYNAGSLHSFTYQSPLVALANSKQYTLTDIDTTSNNGLSFDESGLIIADAPMTITGKYKTQYHVSFGQLGVSNDFKGTVVSIDGSNYAISALPISLWFDSGTKHNFVYQSPLTVSGNQKRYVWGTSTGLSRPLQSATLTTLHSGIITANYKTQ